MDTFINLLIDNYIWLIAISIFLIFALIGFLTESSSSEPKQPKEPKEIKEKVKKSKKEKTNKKSKKEDIIEDNTPTIGQLMEEEQKKTSQTVEQLDTSASSDNINNK